MSHNVKKLLLAWTCMGPGGKDEKKGCRYWDLYRGDWDIEGRWWVCRMEVWAPEMGIKGKEVGPRMESELSWWDPWRR